MPKNRPYYGSGGNGTKMGAKGPTNKQSKITRKSTSKGAYCPKESKGAK